MAVAAGALSPLLVAGAGLGVWKLVSMKKDMLRSDSMMTNSSDPPDYISLRGMTQREISNNVVWSTSKAQTSLRVREV